MRRLLSLAALLLCLCLLAGCGENEPIPLEYTSSVVIEAERPDPSLVWAGRFRTPTSGMGKINFADSAFFGVVRAGEIAEHKLGDQRDLCPAYHTGSLWKLLGWTGEAYREQIGVYIDSRSYTSWHDAVLFHFPVEAEHHQYKGKPVRYAGHYLLIEYRPAEEKVYFEAVPLEDFRDARPGAINALYRHRIGDRIYFANGYYSLTEHHYLPYATEEELPPYPGLSHSTMTLAEIIRADPRLKDYGLDKRLIGRVETLAQLGDRLYATAVIGNRYYVSDPTGEFVAYAGTELWVFMADAETGELLWAERYHLANYWQGSSALGFYRQAEDGRLFAPYLP